MADTQYRTLDAAATAALDQRLSRIRTTLAAVVGLCDQYEDADDPVATCDFAVLTRELALRVHGQLDDLSAELGGERDGPLDEQ